MSERFELRITRYRDGLSFDQVVDLLSQLFPQRARDELASGLAVTPVHLSHSASRPAAEGLREALTELGATVNLHRIDEDFIAMTRLRRMQGEDRSAPPPAANDDVVKPPWEAD